MSGRPESQIDWKQVDKFLEAGCNGVQIAARLGIHATTLYRHCEEDHKINFALYSQEKKASGDALLHAAQFNKALKGDSGMLKWLGEIRLNQKSSELDNIKDTIKDAADAIREIQGNAGGIPSFGKPNMETQQPVLDQGSTGKENPVSDELGTEGII